MFGIELAPCGKKDCTGCKTCKYDISLDVLFKKTQNRNMKNFGLVPMLGNPSTAQLILPGVKGGLPPLADNDTQLALPFNENVGKKNQLLYCNGCEHFLRLLRPNKESFNTRCSAEKPINGCSYRVIKLNVYPDEKVKKPFWCPIIKNSIINGLSVPKATNSAMSDEQQKNWNRIKEETLYKEKWLAIGGITSWDDIKIGEKYHLPPTFKKNRIDFEVKQKYINSIQCVNLKTNEQLWLYKNDEEYKFLSVIK